MVDRFQKLIDQSPDAILIDVGGRIVYVNNAIVRLFGAASPAEMLGRSRLEFIHPDCHAAVKERIKKLIQDAEPVAALDKKWFHLDGGVIDCQQGKSKGNNEGGFMEEVPEVAALFGRKADLGGISPIERLLNEFEAHEMKEEKSLEQYKELMGDLPNPVTRFLLQLIISDEEKHRAVIHAMVATLKGSLTWTKPEGSLESTRELSKTYDRLRAITEEFIELEKEGIRESKRLVKESSGYYHGVFKILLDSMMRDSEKHIELLKFLRANLKQP